MVLTQEYVQAQLRYDPATGEFWWRKPKPGRRFFVRADKPHAKGYRILFLDGKFWLAHSIAWLYVNGELIIRGLDHRDRVRDNNRINNLRRANQSQNNMNRVTKVAKSGFKGVSWSRSSQKWMARIKSYGHTFYLGVFDTPEEAHAAYLENAKLLFGKQFVEE